MAESGGGGMNEPKIFPTPKGADLRCRVLVDGKPLEMREVSSRYMEGEEALAFFDSIGSGWIRDEIKKSKTD